MLLELSLLNSFFFIFVPNVGLISKKASVMTITICFV